MLDSTLEELNTKGWSVIPNALDASLVEGVKRQLEPSLNIRDRIRRGNQVDGKNDGTLHHLLGDDPVYLDVLASYEAFDSTLRSYFSGLYVLNSYGGVINEHMSNAYVHEIHRDVRFSSRSKRFMLNTLLMLDDFTLANGATFLLSGSFDLEHAPESGVFFRDASRATGISGSMLLFDSRLWHATGKNSTATPRRALTLTFTSPLFKPQLDYPRLLGYDRVESYSPFLRQVIGYNSRVPASLEEFYVPVAHRFYQRGQDE